MKIAIMTQPLGHNYGGILQNYALTKILEDINVEVTTINRLYPKRPLYRIILSNVKNRIFNRLTNNYHYVLTKKDKISIYKENLDFIDRYLNLSEPIYETKSLKKYFAKNKFNAVIVGSDQTWRPKYSPCISNYFLDFLKKNKRIRKVAFASSFGTGEWEFTAEQTKSFSKLAKKFDAISVRESSARLLCEKYLKVAAEHVLDPTLLIDKSDYIKLINDKKSLPAIDNEYRLFNYILDDTQEKREFVDQLSDLLGKKSFRTQPKRKMTKINKDHLSEYRYPSIEQWLNSFYHADFIITDSFHGTALSVIFNKPFISLVNQERGADRFISFLNTIGLKHRMLNNISDFTPDFLNDEIDYRNVNAQLQLLKENSLNFLKSSLI